MKLTLTFLILLAFSFTQAQTLDEYLRIKSRLTDRLGQINDSLTKVDKEIGRIRLNQIKVGNGVVTTLKEYTRLLDDPYGKLVQLLKIGDSVMLLDWKESNLLIEYKGNRGYIPQASVNTDESINDVIKSLEVSARKKHEAEVAKRADNYRTFKDEQKRDELKKTYPTWSSQIINDIVEKKIWIGMTADMARESWGEPSKINRTVSGSYGVKEQWVYGNDYLYFKSGVLETYQVGR